VTNTLRLLALTDEEKTALLKGQISSGHARALLSLPEGVSRMACLKAIIKNNLSVRETEKLVKKILTPKERAEKPRDVHIVQVENELAEVFGSKVSIQDTAGKGKVSIEFYNKDDRDRILEFLLKLTN
jgi:ParB family chromosome partitioning protein